MHLKQVVTQTWMLRVKVTRCSMLIPSESVPLKENLYLTRANLASTDQTLQARLRFADRRTDTPKTTYLNHLMQRHKVAFIVKCFVQQILPG